MREREKPLACGQIVGSHFPLACLDVDRDRLTDILALENRPYVALINLLPATGTLES